MKTFAACVMHETNSFSPIPTDLSSFKDAIFYHPASDSASHPAPTYVGYTDFITWAEGKRYDVARSVLATAEPSGPMRKSDYLALRTLLLDDLRRAMPLDIVFLMLHGAQMAETIDDCEGDLIAAVRELVGPDTVIAVELDLHCTLTDKMMRNATLIASCKEYPHIDFSETAIALSELAERTKAGTITPTMAAVRVPLVGAFPTTREPLRSLVDAAKALEDGEEILSVSINHGFPWADTPDTGASVLVVTNNDPARAQALAEDLGQRFLDIRHDLHRAFPTVAEAIDEALAFPDRPVVIADIADNPGGGAPGDATFILEALLERGVRNAAVAMIWDPIAVDLIAKAGEGATVNLRIGGKIARISGKPLDVEARVLKVLEHADQILPGTTKRASIGKAVAITVDGIDIVLCSQRRQTFGTECFSQFGIDPAAKDILVVKSTQHFQASFSKISRKIIHCEAPGLLNSDISRFPFRRLTRPLWPIDDVSTCRSLGQ